MWISVQNTYPFWHFDATGTIIKPVKNQSEPFLFSIVFHDQAKSFIFPLAEFISTGHDAKEISQYLSTIKLDLQKTIPKSVTYRIAPFVVTDFSWGLINAVLSVFNNCKADFYINWCFEILFNRVESTLILNIMQTRLILCAAHFIKMVSKKVKAIKKYESDDAKNKKLQNSFLFSFALLQNSITIHEFSTNLKHVFNIFNLKFQNKQSSKSAFLIKKQVVDRDIETITILKKNEKNNIDNSYKLKKKKVLLVDDDFNEKSF